MNRPFTLMASLLTLVPGLVSLAAAQSSPEEPSRRCPATSFELAKERRSELVG